MWWDYSHSKNVAEVNGECEKLTTLTREGNIKYIAYES